MSAGRKVNSLSQSWGTPVKYIDAIKIFFGGSIDLDPCSNDYSLVGANVEYRLPAVDGLTASWNYPRIFVNPPYGHDRTRGTRISHWLARCVEANRLYHSEVLALVPVATNTGHWKASVWGEASGIVFLADTRLKFLVDGQPGGNGAPMACCIVYWGGRTGDFRSVFSPFGAVIIL